MQIKVVKKGEPFTMPLNHASYQWICQEAEQNGILLTIGPSKGMGVFITERRLREIIKMFEQEIKK